MDIYVLDLMGSNRTFMELKSYKGFTTKESINGSNRTFMELKSRINHNTFITYPVLIVPLWN